MSLTLPLALILLSIGIYTHNTEGKKHDKGIWYLPWTSQPLHGPDHLTVDCGHIMLLTIMVLIASEFLPYFLSWITRKRSSSSTAITSSGSSLLDHIRDGVLLKDPYSFSMYSAYEISTFLPVLIHSILSIPPSLSWYRQQVLFKLLCRIENDESLIQSLNCFLFSNQTTLSDGHSIVDQLDRITLRNSSRNSTLRQLWTTLTASTHHGHTTAVHEYFYLDIYNGNGSKSPGGNRPNSTGNTQKVPVPPNQRIYDPIACDSKLALDHVEVLKVIASNARPVLVECHSSPPRCCKSSPITKSPKLSRKLLLKEGDDLRKDVAVLLMFRFMNHIWKREGVQYHGLDIASFVYGVVPMGPEFGCIEMVERCIKISDLEKSEHSERRSGPGAESVCSEIGSGTKVNQLVASAVGSYLCSYIVGVRDRHHDNILIQTEDAILFHIDFAYILGEKITGLDAAKVAIPSVFVQVLGPQKWIEFIHEVKRSYAVLRRHREELIQFGCMAFRYGYSEQKVREYLSKALCVDCTETKAMEFIADKFSKSPNRIQTKMKNAIHDIAVKRISVS